LSDAEHNFKKKKKKKLQIHHIGPTKPVKQSHSILSLVKDEGGNHFCRIWLSFREAVISQLIREKRPVPLEAYITHLNLQRANAVSCDVSIWKVFLFIHDKEKLYR
jgi:hypothetical protein